MSLKNTHDEYIITKLKRLVDLNNNVTNFKLRFTVSAIDGPDTPFECIVLDQEILDNIDESNIEFKHVKGSLSGEVISDKNIYKNYLLLMRADNPTTVTVDITMEELPERKPLSQNKPVVESIGFFKKNKELIVVLLCFLIAALLYYKKKPISIPSVSKLSLLDKLKNVANTTS